MSDVLTPPALNESGDAGSARKQTRRIVDADAHIEAPHEAWADYLPENLRDRAPKIEHGEEHDWIVFEGKRRPVMLIQNQAGRDGKNFKMVGRRDEQRKVWLPEVRIADMDTDGMDTAIMYGGGPLPTTDADLYIASFDAYNRWVFDYSGYDRRRLIPVGYVPTRDPDETVAMLKRYAKMGFTTVNIPAFPQASGAEALKARAEGLLTGKGDMGDAQAAALTGDPSGGRSYASAEWEPLWAALQDLDLTVTMHLGGRLTRFQMKEHFLPDLVMTKLAMAEPVAIAIYNGIFQKYPKLRFGIIESGVAWMSWMAEYMDRTWEKQRYWVDSTLTEKPSFFMDRNVYGSFINDRNGILNYDRPGGKNIMWSSDYPHSETTWPNSDKVIARDFAGIPENIITEITCTTAEKFYKITG